ncbi:MAG: tRNA isopentenyl-2-thiomethyl-A-37 hydroxylase MiaE [Gammaproteobacteria bacterium]
MCSDSQSSPGRRRDGTPRAASADLPLRWSTPPAWAAAALADPLALLGDHAHLERKAASNALDLLTRWRGDVGADEWARMLGAIARDEAQHLHAVLRMLQRRGGALPRVHRNSYAAALHRLVRRGDGARELLDRLLVAALIEARSCERFALLAGTRDDAALAAFFGSLHGSELGHYRVFLRLADMVVPAGERARRWATLCDAEAAIIRDEAPGSRIHSGPPR